MKKRLIQTLKRALIRACANEQAHSEDNQCCCQRMLATQSDFVAECSALQHAVETRVTIAGVTCNRHLCLFLPKFHCELNWIERMWGASKAYCRSHCMYTLQGLRDTVPLSLSQDMSDLPDGESHSRSTSSAAIFAAPLGAHLAPVHARIPQGGRRT